MPGKPPSGSAESTVDLALTEARWQAVLETARDAIVSIDRHGVIELFNPMAERMFGFAAAEVIGRNVSVLMPPPYRGEHDRYLRRYQSGGSARAIGRIREVQGIRKNGEVFPIQLSVGEGQVGAEPIYTAIIRDVTLERRAQTEIEKARRLAAQHERLADVGALSAKIVHDIGNPIAGLYMSAQSIARRLEREGVLSEASAKRPLDRILATVDRLDGMISEFKQFLQEQRLEIALVPVADLIEDLRASWKDEARSRSIELSVDLPAVSVTVRADEAKLRRVLDNLVKNALEAIDVGPGQVRLAALEVGSDRVALYVEDDGPGVQDGVGVFELFETTKAEGSGLGLAIAKQIIAAHGGTLEFENLDPAGARFVIELPRGAPSAVRR